MCKGKRLVAFRNMGTWALLEDAVIKTSRKTFPLWNFGFLTCKKPLLEGDDFSRLEREVRSREPAWVQWRASAT